LAILAVFATVALGLTIYLLAQTFVSGLQEVAAIPARASRGKRYRWIEGLALATFWKDLRLIARDPLLLAQILPQTVFIIPMAIPAFRWLGLGALAPLAFMIALILSGTLTAVSVAGEECWDLIRMSPSPELRLRNSKLAAGMAIPLLIAAAIGIGLAAAGRPILGMLTFVVSFACSAGVSRLAASEVALAPRKDIMRRSRLGSGGMGRNVGTQVFAAFYFMITGAGGLGCAAKGSGWFPTAGAILIALALLGAAACFAFVKLEAIIWRENEVRP
jgi:ABC-2 type transport system permease protein